ncbi:hypothetical protein CABS03_00915 [Colletotrichum abscissum]|uniref:Rhodopsin domain-containing protein n=1 Tax=Colletotrichum abscissum TaxID=1671311 RepID=A0A9Q0B4C2_9PEZI|nr:hypothetical protein CABS02_03076 [Colletotrichum abscissum]
MASLPVPDGIDLSESRVASIIGALSCTWALAAIAVALRFLARRIQSNKLWLEDWLITVSLTAAAVHVFISIGYMIPNGTGEHIWVAPTSATRAWAIGLFVSEVAYTVTLSTVKWSTLALYWRIFNARKSIRYYIWAMAGIVLAWFIAVILVTIFQCLPVHAFWARYDTVKPLSSDQYTCGVDVKMFFKGNSIPNIITDALVVLLPIPYVWKLQLHKAQKFALAGIFALGTFVTVVSMARLNVILSVDLTSPDITWNFIDTIIWTNVEANTAIICELACLPCLKPILNLALNGRLKSSIKRSGQNSGGQYILNDRTKPSTANGSSYLGGSGTGAMRKGLGGGGAEDERPFTRLSERDSEPSIDVANDDGGSGHESLSKGRDDPIEVIERQKCVAEELAGEAIALEAVLRVSPTTADNENAAAPAVPVAPASLAAASSPAPAALTVAVEDPDPSTDGYESGGDSRVLKPAGWIKLQELRWRFACDDDTTTPDYAPSRMTNLIEEGLSKFGSELYASETNPERLRAGGFVTKVHNIKKVPLGRWPKDDNLRTIGL